MISWTFTPLLAQVFVDNLDDESEFLPEDEIGGPFDLSGETDATTVSDDWDFIEIPEEVKLDESDPALAETRPDEDLFGAPGTDLSEPEPDDGAEKA